MGQYYTSVGDSAPRTFTAARSRSMLRRPGATVSPSGDFAIAWRQAISRSSDEVHFVAIHSHSSAYLEATAGTAKAMPAGAFQYVAPPQVLPVHLPPSMVNQGPTQIVFDEYGNIVLVWETYEGGHQKIVGRGYSADGASPNGVTDIASSSGKAYFNPVAARLKGLKFALAWTQLDGLQLDIHAKTIYHLAPAGLFDTHNPEARVNSVWRYNQWHPAIATDSVDKFVVTWDDDLDGNGSWEIIGRGCHASLYDELCEWPERY